MPDFDANATTPLHPSALEAMIPVWKIVHGNASSPHAVGRKARQCLDDARERIAACLDASPGEVILTSGATEANNLAIHGLAAETPGHIVTSGLEHPCVVEPIRYLEKLGWTVTRIVPTAEGFVPVDLLRSSIRPETRFAAIMLANHETGAVNTIPDMTGRCPFHTDAAQAVGKIPVSFRKLGVTTMSVSAHKFRGPNGVGALIVKTGTKLRPLLLGGGQQDGRRPGTEPIALAVGMAVALEQAVKSLTVSMERLKAMRLKLAAGLVDLGMINGPAADAKDRLPGTLNVSFTGCRSDVLLMKLDLAGITASAGSACASGAMLPSPVLAAMGIEGDRLRAAVRFSWTNQLTDEEFDASIPIIRDCVAACRMTT